MRRQTPGARILHSLRQRGVLAWVIFALLAAFYLLLYFGLDSRVFGRPWMDDVGRGIAGLALPDAWLGWLRPDRWFLYGSLYTLAILAGGGWMLHRYRHNRYQVVRTSVVMGVQVVFAFAIPHLLKFFHHPEYYFSYIWPLKIDALDPNTIAGYTDPESGYAVVLPYVAYSFLSAIVLVPVMTLLFGKRWYCSWVCGCGGLANTFGEPWRHLSTKSSWSWRVEKISIHAVLVVAFLGTALWILSALMPDVDPLRIAGEKYRWWYGKVVTAALAGLAGVALYPLGGTRIWCRFFCPMAALLGLIQKFGRFRIRVKRDMCISCGLCSKYCEMGIDVRTYAQANRSFTRASCVGCGLCSEVCPRGVLRLENQRPWDPQELAMRGDPDEHAKGDESAIDAVR